jgi:phage FluMu protein Com
MVDYLTTCEVACPNCRKVTEFKITAFWREQIKASCVECEEEVVYTRYRKLVTAEEIRDYLDNKKREIV